MNPLNPHRVLMLALAALALPLAPTTIHAQTLTKPNVLLSVDQNRIVLVERIAQLWQQELPSAQLVDFKSKLMALRADQLLNVHLATNFDAVLLQLDNASTTLSQNDIRKVDKAKALGEIDRDLLYTPVNPCRIFDTRPSQGGPGNIATSGVRTFDTIRAGSNYASQGGTSASDCGIPLGAVAVAISLGSFSHTAAGYITVYPTDITNPFPAVVTQAFDPNDIKLDTVITKVQANAGGSISLFANVATDASGQILGYFMPPSRVGNGLRVIQTGTLAAPTSPIVINGSAANTASGVGTTIAGGGSAALPNVAGGNYSTVGGGEFNSATNNYGTVAGGFNNKATFQGATVSGGDSNSAAGSFSTVPGGINNTVTAGSYSFVAGRRAKSNTDGQFVWADSNDIDFRPTNHGNFTATSAFNAFSVRATGGVEFVTAIHPISGIQTASCFIPAGGSGWSCTSDKNVKDRIKTISPKAILSKVVNMPVSAWSFKGTDAKHVGPMAQDFYKAFALGTTDRAINSIDAQGISFAAIQGLNQKLNDELKVRNAEVAALKREASEMQVKLQQIKTKLGIQ